MSALKTVNLILTTAVKVDGVHVEAGELLRNCSADLALELTASGRARLASEAESAPEKKTSGKPA